MIAQCLEAAGIEKVVWIDDNFARRTRQQCGEAIERALRSLHASSTNRSITIPHFTAFDLNRPVDDVLDQYEDEVARLDEDDLDEATKAIERIAGLEDNRPTSRDLTTEEINALLGAFAEKVTKQSMGDWTSGGAGRFPHTDRKTLFLIDREFEKEPTTLTGMELLADLANGQAFCIMFTCHCGENEEEQRRLDYSRQKNISPHCFSVISKLNATQPILERFARALRASVVHRHTGDLANQLAMELTASTKKTVDVLVAQSVSDIDQAIFENSLEEGASELDVLLRIFSLNQRRDARQAFQGNRLRGILGEMRRFRQLTATHLRNDPKPTMEEFRKWRRAEVYEEGSIINPIHSPLCCGDIFECTKTTPQGQAIKKTFVLLGQPCDLMVRDNGTRNADAGLMVLLSEELRATAKEVRNPQRFHEISGVLPPDRMWRVDFLTAFAADLGILDYCVLNQSGEVRLDRTMNITRQLLTEGYGKVFDDAKKFVEKLAANTASLKPLSIGKRGNQFAGKPVGSNWAYPLQRIGRFESTMSQAILAAWASYHTRAALDHDFARAGEEPAAAPADTAPADAGTQPAAAPANGAAQPIVTLPTLAVQATATPANPA